MNYVQLFILLLGIVLVGIVTMDYTQKNSASGNGFGGSRPFQSIFSLLASYLIIGCMVFGGVMVFDGGSTPSLPANLADQLGPLTPQAPAAPTAPPVVSAPQRPQEQARVVPAPTPPPSLQVPPPPPTVTPRNHPQDPVTYAIPPPKSSAALIAEPLRGRNHYGPGIFYLIPEGAVADPDKMLARMRGDNQFHLFFRLVGRNLFKVGYGPFDSWEQADSYRRSMGLKHTPLPYRWR